MKSWLLSHFPCYFLSFGGGCLLRHHSVFKFSLSTEFLKIWAKWSLESGFLGVVGHRGVYKNFWSMGLTDHFMNHNTSTDSVAQWGLSFIMIIGYCFPVVRKVWIQTCAWVSWPISLNCSKCFLFSCRFLHTRLMGCHSKMLFYWVFTAVIFGTRSPCGPFMEW